MKIDSSVLRKLPLVSVLAATAVGILAKLNLTRSELLPGIDGAYYWVQVRSILENQTLAFSDLPFVFWIQAGIAQVVGNVPLAVRISDAVLPAISAIPIYFIAKKYRKPFLPAIAILIVLLHPIQLYYFTGDFIKNEATIPAVFFMALILINWDKKSKRFSILSIVGLTLLIAISHFGTLFLALMLVGTWALFQLRKSSFKFWLRGIAISVGALALSLAILAILVPTRYERLVNLITTPTVIFQNPAYDRILQGSSLSVVTFAIIISQISSVILGAITWYSRSKYSFSDLSLVISSLITTFIFSSPFIGMEWSDRLAGLSFVSLSIAAIIIFGSAEKLIQKLPVAILATVTLLSSLPLSNFDLKRVFSDEEYSNFKDLASNVEISQNSVIVARHGVEFLSAWEFGTDVVLDTYYDSADLSSYGSVYYIQESKSFAPGIGGGGTGQKPTSPPGGTGQKPTSPPGGTGEKFTPPPGGKGPSDMGGKKDMPMDQPKKVEITGETVYSNNSFAVVKVR